LKEIKVNDIVKFEAWIDGYLVKRMGIIMAINSFHRGTMYEVFVINRGKKFIDHDEIKQIL
jgi:hypothetical protein